MVQKKFNNLDSLTSGGRFKCLNQFCAQVNKHYMRDVSSICEISYRAILPYFSFVACEISRLVYHDWRRAKCDRLILRRFFDSATFVLANSSESAANIIIRVSHWYVDRFFYLSKRSSLWKRIAAPKRSKYFGIKLLCGRKERKREKPEGKIRQGQTRSGSARHASAFLSTLFPLFSNNIRCADN